MRSQGSTSPSKRSRTFFDRSSATARPTASERSAGRAYAHPVASTPPAASTSEPEDRFLDVRHLTAALAAPLSAEDQIVQSMPDASPTNWHRAHTTWFFEEFVVAPERPDRPLFDPSNRYLFNSYYEAVGPRQPRAARGMITRPGVDEITDYRDAVDRAVTEILAGTPSSAVLDLVELGINHEQQHQELLLMDVKHLLAQNPTDPVYRAASGGPRSTNVPALGWVGHEGGRQTIGWSGDGFAYDNESPAHHVWLQPFELATRPVSNAEVLAFIEDGGYQRSDLWLSDGWAAVQGLGWDAPLYWKPVDELWTEFTLSGRRPVDPAVTTCHLSYYEADALARWAGARLPTEAEWEAAAGAGRPAGNLLDLDVLHPRAAEGGPGLQQMYGDVWEWTASAYLPYPGFRPWAGAVGEYNGKFMVGQHVLRGGSCATPVDHVRRTYRNFFPPGARWAFSGVRLARDVDR